MPEDGKEIWKDNYINLNYSMTDDEILETLQKALKYKSLLNKKSKNMSLKMSKYYLNKFSQKLYFKIQLNLIS